jgi:Holliday junction resolvasome RuvABC endonuclease subunit
MSLIMPVNYNNIRLLGIDPGVNNTGIAIFDLDFFHKKILSIEAYTLVNSKLPNYTGLDEEFFPERTVKLYKLKAAINYVLNSVNPCIVACESPFYNRLRPMAYGSLLEVLNAIHVSIIEYNHNVQFYTIEPLLVKKTIGAGMMKGKVDVKDSMLKRNDIMSVLKNNIDALDEHSIDAIAVGYSFLARLEN